MVGAPPGLGLWESSPYPYSCCLSRCQSAVLLQDLNFWKLTKTCLLWVGSGASGCRPRPLFGALLLPCWAPGTGSGRGLGTEWRRGQPCCSALPGVNFSAEPGQPAAAPLTYLLASLSLNANGGGPGGKLHSGSGRSTCLYLGKSLPICPPPVDPACPFPTALTGLAVVHFERSVCPSAQPWFTCREQASPWHLRGAFGGLGRPALVKLWGEEVREEASFDPMRR